VTRFITAKELSAFIVGNPSPRQIQRKHGEWNLVATIRKVNARLIFYDMSKAEKILRRQGLLNSDAT